MKIEDRGMKENSKKAIQVERLKDLKKKKNN
jgi:hypothetical protein